MHKVYFPLHEDYYIWCPQLAVKFNGKLVSSGNHGWANHLIEDWEYIYESREDSKNMYSLEKQKRHFRIIFAKSKDGLGNYSYRFIGVFEYDEAKSTEEIRVYRRSAISYLVV